MTFDPKSVEVTCVTLPKDHCVQVPRKYIKVCGYSDPFFKNLNKRSLTPRWPMTPCLLRSHVWLYPQIIVSKSHENQRHSQPFQNEGAARGAQGLAGGGTDWDSKWRLSIDLCTKCNFIWGREGAEFLPGGGRPPLWLRHWQKYIKVCGYSDLFYQKLNQRSLIPKWPCTSCLLKSHVWLYPRIITCVQEYINMWIQWSILQITTYYTEWVIT